MHGNLMFNYQYSIDVEIPLGIIDNVKKLKLQYIEVYDHNPVFKGISIQRNWTLCVKRHMKYRMSNLI